MSSAWVSCGGERGETGAKDAGKPGFVETIGGTTGGTGEDTTPTFGKLGEALWVKRSDWGEVWGEVWGEGFGREVCTGGVRCLAIVSIVVSR